MGGRSLWGGVPRQRRGEQKKRKKKEEFYYYYVSSFFFVFFSLSPRDPWQPSHILEDPNHGPYGVGCPDRGEVSKKLDDGWPESEKGDVTAAVNMMITR